MTILVLTPPKFPGPGIGMVLSLAPFSRLTEVVASAYTVDKECLFRTLATPIFCPAVAGTALGKSNRIVPAEFSKPNRPVEPIWSVSHLSQTMPDFIFNTWKTVTLLLLTNAVPKKLFTLAKELVTPSKLR